MPQTVNRQVEVGVFRALVVECAPQIGGEGINLP